MIKFRLLPSLVFVSGSALVLAAPAPAQPPAHAVVDPEPVMRAPRPHHERQPQAHRQDNLVSNFEAMFGRKLSDDQLKQLQKATDDRNAAVRAAQQAWRAQFLAITGVTEEELRQKQRELRQKEKADEAAKRQANQAAGAGVTGATIIVPVPGAAIAQPAPLR